VTQPAVFLAPPLTASALCAIFLAMLTGLPFAGHSAGWTHRPDIPGGNICSGLRSDRSCGLGGGLPGGGSVPEHARPAPAAVWAGM
jgi:hypothetical protein